MKANLGVHTDLSSLKRSLFVASHEVNLYLFPIIVFLFSFCLFVCLFVIFIFNSHSTTVKLLYVSGNLHNYPSPKPTLTLTSHLGQNVGLGEG